MRKVSNSGTQKLNGELRCEKFVGCCIYIEIKLKIDPDAFLSLRLPTIPISRILSFFPLVLFCEVN